MTHNTNSNLVVQSAPNKLSPLIVVRSEIAGVVAGRSTHTKPNWASFVPKNFSFHEQRDRPPRSRQHPPKTS